MNPNQNSDSSAGFRSIVDDDAIGSLLREATALPGTSVQNAPNRTFFSSSSIISSVLAQEERNQAIANANTNGLNSNILCSNQAVSSLGIGSPFRTLVPSRERNRLLFGAESSQQNATTESRQSASDALNNIILRQALQSQNSRDSTALIGTSSDFNLHRASVGGIGASNAIGNLLCNNVPASIVDARNVAALDIGASSIGKEVPAEPSGPVADLLSNVGPHNMAGVNNSNLSNMPLLSSRNNRLQRNQIANQAIQYHHALSQAYDVLSQSRLRQESSALQSTKKQGRPALFLKNLYQMLLDLENQPGGSSIASFVLEGRAFAVHKPEEFVKDVIPKYFKMSCLSSFQRQLNMYGFRQLALGAERGAYYNERFVRGQPQLLTTVQRSTVKSQKKNSMISRFSG